MVNCVVPGCGKFSGKRQIDKTLRFYSFPKDPKLLKEWNNACNNHPRINTKDARICSRHFKEDDYKLQDILLNLPHNKRRLKQDAIPTQNLLQSIENYPSSSKRTHPPLNEVKQEVEIHFEYVPCGENENTAEEVVKDFCVASDSQQTNLKSARNLGAGTSKVVIKKEATEAINFQDVSVQTEVDMECSKELQIMCLQREVKLLKRRQKEFAKRLQQAENTIASINKIFTKGQVRRLQDNCRNLHWSSEDISWALCLYSKSPRAYRLLRKRGFPLPGVSTLKSWAFNFKLRPE